MAVVIDGKMVAASLRSGISEELARLGEGGKVGLAVVIVGVDPASELYVRLKHKACKDVGMDSFQYELPEETTQEELLALVDKLNNDPKVNGILVQLPLPKHIDSDSILTRIDPIKDVDGFHPVNAGLLAQGMAKLEPCTAAGCIKLLEEYDVPIEGSNAVVLGRSNIVGKPVALMLLHRNATVTICHSRTRNMAEVVSGADIVIAATGAPMLVTADMVKEGAAVIDVGTGSLNGKLVGDVDFDGVSKVAGHISPVPGGVGPMTIAYLLQNTLIASRLQRENK